MTRATMLALLVVISFLATLVVGNATQCVHGSLVDGTCVCKPGFYGVDCSSGTGICVESTHEGCLNGHCKGGECICKPGFYGDRCENKGCPKDCSFKGLCLEVADEAPRCLCMFGYFGEDCSLSGCGAGCKHGKCIMTTAGNTRCECEPGYAGEDCSMRVCNQCIHGQCKGTECVCESGWDGVDCNKRTCPPCGERGTCNHATGKCLCKTPFFNRPGGLPDCSGNQNVCPNKCTALERGICLADGCKCRPGWAGADCSESTCPKNCNFQGECKDGRCFCEAGFTGEDCAQRVCPNNCNNRGLCINGQCKCLKPFSLEAIKSLPALRYQLNTHVNVTQATLLGAPVVKNQQDQDSVITCPPPETLSSKIKDAFFAPLPIFSVPSGFAAEDCHQSQCVTDCGESASQGKCDSRTGMCMCNTGFYSKVAGQDCSLKLCDNKCSNNGLCVDNKCQCLDGFTGTECEMLTSSLPVNTHASLVEVTTVQSMEEQMSLNARNNAYIDAAREHILLALKESTEFEIKLASNAVVDDALAALSIEQEHDAAIAAAYIDQFGSKSSSFVHVLATTEGEAAARAALDNINQNVNGPLTDDEIALKNKVQKQQKQYYNEVNHIKRVNNLLQSYNVSLGNGCLGSCSGRGLCVLGKCKCHESYGQLCEHRACPLGCSGHGKCNTHTGQCECYNGFGGLACNEASCNPHNCNNHGTCQTYQEKNKYNQTLAVVPKCVCHEGWSGSDCNIQKCAKSCSNRGTCANETCFCAPGFRGENCELGPFCANDCGANGKCVVNYNSANGKVSTTCQCNVGFTGKNCDLKQCTPAEELKCGKHGACFNGKCACEAGWAGEICDFREGCENCSAYGGKCEENNLGQPVCVCKEGYGGPDCKYKTCANNCSKRGSCFNGYCHCQNGWSGDSCEKGCPMDCSSRGTCATDTKGQPKCECKEGFYGSGCQYARCPGSVAGPLGQPTQCSSHGECDTSSGKCQCKPGFGKLVDCSVFSASSCTEDCKTICRYGQRGAFPVKDFVTGQVAMSTSRQCMQQCTDICQTSKQ